MGEMAKGEHVAEIMFAFCSPWW